MLPALRVAFPAVTENPVRMKVEEVLRATRAERQVRHVDQGVVHASVSHLFDLVTSLDEQETLPVSILPNLTNSASVDTAQRIANQVAVEEGIVVNLPAPSMDPPRNVFSPDKRSMLVIADGATDRKLKSLSDVLTASVDETMRLRDTLRSVQAKLGGKDARIMELEANAHTTQLSMTALELAITKLKRRGVATMRGGGGMEGSPRGSSAAGDGAGPDDGGARMSSRKSIVDERHRSVVDNGSVIQVDFSLDPVLIGPKGHVALVIVSVSHFKVMKARSAKTAAKAMQLLSDAMRVVCDSSDGFEFRSDDETFGFSFDDGKGAVDFCLRLLRQLHNHVSWPTELEAHDDTRTFSTSEDAPFSAGGGGATQSKESGGALPGTPGLSAPSRSFFRTPGLSPSAASGGGPTAQLVTLFRGLRPSIGIHMGTWRGEGDKLLQRASYEGDVLAQAIRVARSTPPGLVYATAEVLKEPSVVEFIHIEDLHVSPVASLLPGLVCVLPKEFQRRIAFSLPVQNAPLNAAAAALPPSPPPTAAHRKSSITSTTSSASSQNKSAPLCVSVCIEVEGYARSLQEGELSSTELMQALELVRQFMKDQLDTCCKRVGSRAVICREENRGEKTIILFSSAVDAVDWAMQVQSGAMRLPWPKIITETAVGLEEYAQVDRVPTTTTFNATPGGGAKPSASRRVLTFAGLRLQMGIDATNVTVRDEADLLNHLPRYTLARESHVIGLCRIARGGETIVSKEARDAVFQELRKEQQDVRLSDCLFRKLPRKILFAHSSPQIDVEGYYAALADSTALRFPDAFPQNTLSASLKPISSGIFLCPFGPNVFLVAAVISGAPSLSASNVDAFAEAEAGIRRAAGFDAFRFGGVEATVMQADDVRNTGSTIMQRSTGPTMLFLFRNLVDATRFASVLHVDALQVPLDESLCTSQYTLAKVSSNGTPLYQGLRLKIGIHQGGVTVHKLPPNSAKPMVGGRKVAEALRICLAAPAGTTILSSELIALMHSESYAGQRQGNHVITELLDLLVEQVPTSGNYRMLLPTALQERFTAMQPTTRDAAILDVMRIVEDLESAAAQFEEDEKALEEQERNELQQRESSKDDSKNKDGSEGTGAEEDLAASPSAAALEPSSTLLASEASVDAAAMGEETKVPSLGKSPTPSILYPFDPRSCRTVNTEEPSPFVSVRLPGVTTFMERAQGFSKETIKQYVACVKETVMLHSGKELDQDGPDAFLLWFPTILLAVKFAQQLQHTLMNGIKWPMELLSTDFGREVKVPPGTAGRGGARTNYLFRGPRPLISIEFGRAQLMFDSRLLQWVVDGPALSKLLDLAHWGHPGQIVLTKRARTALAEKVTPEDMKLELENPIISTLATRRLALDVQVDFTSNQRQYEETLYSLLPISVYDRTFPTFPDQPIEERRYRNMAAELERIAVTRAISDAERTASVLMFRTLDTTIYTAATNRRRRRRSVDSSSDDDDDEVSSVANSTVTTQSNGPPPALNQAMLDSVAAQSTAVSSSFDPESSLSSRHMKALTKALGYFRGVMVKRAAHTTWNGLAFMFPEVLDATAFCLYLQNNHRMSWVNETMFSIDNSSLDILGTTVAPYGRPGEIVISDAALQSLYGGSSNVLRGFVMGEYLALEVPIQDGGTAAVSDAVAVPPAAAAQAHPIPVAVGRTSSKAAAMAVTAAVALSAPTPAAADVPSVKILSIRPISRCGTLPVGDLPERRLPLAWPEFEWWKKHFGQSDDTLSPMKTSHDSTHPEKQQEADAAIAICAPFERDERDAEFQATIQHVLSGVTGPEAAATLTAMWNNCRQEAAEQGRRVKLLIAARDEQQAAVDKAKATTESLMRAHKSIRSFRNKLEVYFKKGMVEEVVYGNDADIFVSDWLAAMRQMVGSGPAGSSGSGAATPSKGARIRDVLSPREEFFAMQRQAIEDDGSENRAAAARLCSSLVGHLAKVFAGIEKLMKQRDRILRAGTGNLNRKASTRQPSADSGSSGGGSSSSPSLARAPSVANLTRSTTFLLNRKQSEAALGSSGNAATARSVRPKWPDVSGWKQQESGTAKVGDGSSDPQMDTAPLLSSERKRRSVVVMV